MNSTRHRVGYSRQPRDPTRRVCHQLVCIKVRAREVVVALKKVVKFEVLKWSSKVASFCDGYVSCRGCLSVWFDCWDCAVYIRRLSEFLRAVEGRLLSFREKIISTFKKTTKTMFTEWFWPSSLNSFIDFDAIDPLWHSFALAISISFFASDLKLLVDR